MSRHQGRVLAFQAMYAWEVSGRPAGYKTDFSWNDKEHDTLWSSLLLSSCIEKVGELDAIIRKHLQKYELERLGKVELSIMRVAVYELVYQKDIDPAVCIHEAVKIAQDYGSGVSFKLINGVLDAVSKSLQNG